MENHEKVDQRHDRAKEKVTAIEKRVLDPNTSWGELTKLRDELDDIIFSSKVLQPLGRAIIESQGIESEGFLDEDIARVKELREQLQKRINAEEPEEIRNMRHELHTLWKDVISNYKEYIRQGEYQKLFDSIRRALEIEYASKWTTQDLNLRNGKRLDQINQKMEYMINDVNYDEWIKQWWTDLTRLYGITQEQANSLYQYAISAFATWDNYMKLTAMHVLLWFGS